MGLESLEVADATGDEDTAPGGPCACFSCVRQAEYFELASKACLRITMIKTPVSHGEPFVAMLLDARDIIVAAAPGPTQEEALYRALRGAKVIA